MTTEQARNELERVYRIKQKITILQRRIEKTREDFNPYPSQRYGGRVQGGQMRTLGDKIIDIESSLYQDKRELKDSEELYTTYKSAIEERLDNANLSNTERTLLEFKFFDGFNNSEIAQTVKYQDGYIRSCITTGIQKYAKYNEKAL